MTTERADELSGSFLFLFRYFRLLSRLRPPLVVAALAVLVGVVVALSLQLALLGAWGLGASVRDIPLAPVANAQSIKFEDIAAIEFDSSSGPAVAQARDIQVATRDVLAVSVETRNITGKARAVVGWRSTRDLRKAVSATAPMTTGSQSRTTTILLAGHPGWKEVVTQVGLGFDSPRGEPARAVVSNFEFIPATPAGGLRLMGREWFGHQAGIVKASEAANRLLPLSVWLSIASLIAVGAIALFYRRDPRKLADSFTACAALLGALLLAATLFGNQWPDLSLPLLAGLLLAVALLLIVPLWWPQQLAMPPHVYGRWVLVALLFVVSGWLSPTVAAVAVIPALVLLTQTLKPGRWAVTAGVLLLLPLLYVCAAAQQLVPVPALLSPLTDPTNTLASIAIGAAGLPALVLALAAIHTLWPAPAQAPRCSLSAAAAAAWALSGALIVLSVPRIAVQTGGSSAFVALFLPFLACLVAALWPKFRQVAATIDETVAVDAKTEADLSEPALALLLGHADRLRVALARKEPGAARQAVIQMRQIAAGAQATALAELQVGLADNNLDAASAAAKRLDASKPRDEIISDALLELAHRSNDQTAVIALAPGASRTEGNVRALALAELLVNGPDAARSVLAAWPAENTFAREIAELHLLQDNVQDAQQAMVNTGIALNEPIGEAYMARLGIRAQGVAPYLKPVGKLALWHPQLGAAQAAQAEALFAQGNFEGARARFILAMKLDPLLWPLYKRLQEIDSRSTRAETAAPDTTEAIAAT